MYSEQDLNDAVAAGALPGDAAENLRRFIAERRAAPAADEEQFRLVTSFNDIFVAIAGIVLLVATGSLLFGFGPLPMIAVAAVAWGLSEYFTRQRRMALPSILFLAAFAIGVFSAVYTVLGALVVDVEGDTGYGVGVSVAGIVTAAACWFHWRRFGVPITVAAGVAAAVATIVGGVAAVMSDRIDGLNPLFMLLGLASFALAMWWDASDVARRTRRADVAFWLHLLAAPLIVHPVFALLGVFGDDPAPLTAAVVVVIYVLLGAVALIIDRRALMVSALAYVLYAISTLLRAGGLETGFALTGVLIGSALLLLSALWQTLRRPLVGLLPPAWAAKVPPAAA